MESAFERFYAQFRLEARMRHMKNKSFSSDRLAEILSYLNAILKRENLRLEVAVYGGAAVMLYYGAGSRDATEDVDSVIINREQFGRHPDVLKEVAEKFGQHWWRNSI
jgi:hypothetical protein